MEIGTYVRSLLKRSWIVLVIMLVAAGATFAVVHGTTNAYQGSVDVTVPVAQSGTAGANGQYVANFNVALTSPAVIDKVSTATGQSKDALSSGLAANQLGNSSFIEVTYTATQAGKAEQVVVEAAKDTANVLAQPGIDAATTTLDSSKTALATASAQEESVQAALNAYTAKYGVIDPNVLYQGQQSAVTQLNVSKQQAIAQGRPTSGFDAAIVAAQRRLAELTTQVASYNALTRALNQAQLAAATAQARVVSATASVADANAAPIVGTPYSTLVSATSTIIRAVSVAAGLGLVLGLALLLLMELVAATRRRPVE